MALPLLPAKHIPGAFTALVGNLGPAVDDSVEEVIAYMRSTWLYSWLWPPHSWSAYKWSVKTNDMEWWHNRLNHCSRLGQLDIYQLVPLLRKEPEVVSVQASLVSDANLRCHQCKTYAAIAMYAAGDLTMSALLRYCARVPAYTARSTSKSKTSAFALSLSISCKLVHRLSLALRTHL